MYPTVELPEDPHQLSDEQINLLKSLDHELCEIKHSSGRHTLAILHAKRPIAENEVSTLRQLTAEGKLLVCMGGGNFGFGASASFFRHPTIDGAIAGLYKPTCTLSLTADHFQWAGEPNEPKVRTDRIWAAFEDLFYSEQNKRFLAFYKMDAPRERSYYAY